jgi:hypothetical protein
VPKRLSAVSRAELRGFPVGTSRELGLWKLGPGFIGGLMHQIERWKDRPVEFEVFTNCQLGILYRGQNTFLLPYRGERRNGAHKPTKNIDQKM